MRCNLQFLTEHVVMLRIESIFDSIRNFLAHVVRLSVLLVAVCVSCHCYRSACHQMDDFLCISMHFESDNRRRRPLEVDLAVVPCDRSGKVMATTNATAATDERRMVAGKFRRSAAARVGKTKITFAKCLTVCVCVCGTATGDALMHMCQTSSHEDFFSSRIHHRLFRCFEVCKLTQI